MSAARTASCGRDQSAAQASRHRLGTRGRRLSGPVAGGTVRIRDVSEFVLDATQSQEEKPMSKQLMKSPIAAMLLGLTTVVAPSGHVQAAQRTFTIAALEPRGGANVDQEPFPTEPLPAGPGYVLNKPDQTGRWEVVAYLLTPSQIIVNQDDDLTLEFIGINGKSHPITIAGYDKSFELKRGHVTKISFKADQAGVFPIECHTHTPSMRAELVVLPGK